MKSNQRKAGGANQHPDPQQNCGKHNECKWDGKARVSGEVEIKPPEDLLAEYKNGQKANAAHNKDQRLVNRLSFIVLTIYAFLTAYLAYQSKRSGDTGTRELSISSRAWLAPSIESSVFEVGKPLIVVVVFENTGKTPAKNVKTCQIAVLADRGQKPVSLSCPDASLSPGLDVIFPGGKRKRLGNVVGGNNNPLPTPDGILTAPIAESLRSNKRVAMTFGRVEYDDIFGVHHWATFCSAMLIMPPTPGGLPETHIWETCEVGNDIDTN
jgi:hypothetical protein